MSKDTINPTENNNMEYTVTNKQVMHLKEGDVIYNHITKDPADFSKITKIMRPDGLDDTEITCEDGDEIYCDEAATFLCRVPSSPVMIFEEFCKWQELEPDYNKVKTRSLYEGYLIGTRSIVPEMTDEEIGVISRQEYNKLYGEIGTLSEWKLFARDCEIGLIAYRNWLRSQINK